MSVSKELRFKDVDGKETTIEFAVNAENIQESNFTEAKVRENLKSGENLTKMLGKLAKWFTDLSKLAWSGKWADVGDKPGIGDLEGTLGVEKGGTGATSASDARTNLGIGAAATYPIADNDTTNNANYVPTARIVYEHGKEIDALSRDLGGCSFEQDGVDFYIVGADAVRKKLTGNDIYEIAYNEGNGWAGKETIQLDVTNIPDYATLSLDSFKYVALLSSSGTGGATEEITGSYMGVKVLGYDSGSGKLSIQTANAYHPIFIVVIE